jgi:hypothetical protein
MRESRALFGRLLPFIAFAICIATLAAITTLRYVELRRISVDDRGVRIHSHNFDVHVSTNHFLIVSFISAASAASRPIQAINLPAIAIEAIVDGVTRTWPDSWRPAAFGPTPNGLFAWRGLIFPIYGVPFWWFAGLGIDGLTTRRRNPWPVLLLGTVLFGLLLIVGVGLAVASEDRDYRDLSFAFYGLALWVSLFATFPVTWVRLFFQRRAVRKASMDLHGD